MLLSPIDVKSRYQFFILAVISAVVLSLMAIQINMSEEPYQKFFGSIPTAPGFMLVVGFGFVCTLILLKATPFFIVNRDTPKGMLRAVLSAIVFFVLMALVDVVEPFPSDINVALPQSIFFYPSIGFVVEILFHLIPFTLMWLIASRLFKSYEGRALIFLCVCIVSLIEPVFQSFFLDSISIGKAVVVFLIIYGINARALMLFTRSGFVSMYTLRIAYYLLWHIIWGTFRLKILF